jgi:hypothetical protein
MGFDMLELGIMNFANELVKDELGRLKFYGRNSNLNLYSGWYTYDEFKGTKKYYGRIGTILHAEKRSEILWVALELKTRKIYIPSLCWCELLWLDL